MADMLQVATGWLSDVFQESVARNITYTRGAYSVAFAATLGRTLFNLQDQSGLRMQWGDRDYIFPAALLILNSASVKPAVGDRIADSVDGATYEVRAPQGEATYRNSDAGGIDLRVHAVRVA